jgi:hypothetical protein
MSASAYTHATACSETVGEEVVYPQYGITAETPLHTTER